MQTVVSISADFYRLIPSRFPPVALYEGLVSSERFDAIAEAEGRTNPRLRSEKQLVSTGGITQANSPRLQNWNLAPYAYRNPDGSRFFDQNRPALELADDRQTALAISVSRREAFLSRTDEAPIGLDMRMLKTPVSGRFLDLRTYSPDLTKDERWAFGKVVTDDLDGLLYRPPQRPTSFCVAVVRGTALGQTIQTVHYRYVWDGSRIEQLYAFDGIGQVIRSSDLSGERDVLAA